MLSIIHDFSWRKHLLVVGLFVCFVCLFVCLVVVQAKFLIWTERVLNSLDLYTVVSATMTDVFPEQNIGDQITIT